MKLKKSLLVFLSVPLISCSFAPSESSASSSTNPVSSSSSSVSEASSSSLSSTPSEGIIPWQGTSNEGAALLNSADYLSFWDKKNVTTLSLKFTNASLYAMSHYGATDNQKWGDVYFPADLSLQNGTTSLTLSEVGVRMKGNTSRREIADTSGAISQSCHLKLSFKATFDDAMYDLSQFSAFKHDWSTDAAGRSARKSRTLYDMEKLDLKYLPRNGDGTVSQEIYCYQQFNALGIPAPQAKWGQLTLQSESASKSFAYELVEDIDKVFLKRHFSKDEAKGDLYKCVWGAPLGGSWLGSSLARDGAVEKKLDASGYNIGTRVAYGRIGVEDNFNGYHPNYQLKTNDDGEASDFSKMANYINAIWNLRYAKAPRSLLEKVLYVDEFLKFEGYAYLFGNFDDQRNNANNYFLYFLPSSGKAIYLPYDWDWALGLDCGNNCAAYTPFQTTGISSSAIETNVYFTTFLSDSNTSLAYSTGDLQGIYKNAVLEGVDKKALSIETYQSLVSLAPSFITTSELSLVETYMTSKKATIASSIK
jgi:spore coat protein CotH